MELNIKFGIDFELRRVKDTLVKLKWYNSNGYKPKLPEGINKDSSEEEIKNQITKEFNKKRYGNAANQINSDFLKIEKPFSEKLKEVFGKDIQMDFIIYLTNYGTGGSYNPPNKVIFNINNKKGFKTVIHEIVHLIIEPKIQEYKVQHWEKERTVDLILNSKEFSFLNYNFWQGNYNNVEKYLDNLFNSYFFKDQNKFFTSF